MSTERTFPEIHFRRDILFLSVVDPTGRQLEGPGINLYSDLSFYVYTMPA
jgi:hypothetical protein